MIVDKAKIFIKAGDGGNGAVSFHREKYISAGGPDGGDGGNGGNIVFQASDDTRTLVDYRYMRKYIAQAGANGAKKNMRGKNGEDLVLKVPAGTIVIDEDTGKVVADIRTGVVRTVLFGGKGGRGNARFATPTRQAPRFATPGRKTEGHFVILELKSIADVGLIGFPNVGKSTLLSVVSAAKPKIADYHFTTLSPNLGVVKLGQSSFVMADIPGLIEGASEGAGLGHDFLRHIERTRMLVHVLDVSGQEGRDPFEDYRKIRAELCAYSEELAGRPELIAANKTDVTGAEENLVRLRKELEPAGTKIFPVSAASHEGLEPLLRAIEQELAKLPPAEALEEDDAAAIWELEQTERTFEVTRGADGVAEANGGLIDEIFARIDPDDPDSMRHFQKLLVDFGIISALRDFGVKDGDEVRLNGEEFNFEE